MSKKKSTAKPNSSTTKAKVKKLPRKKSIHYVDNVKFYEEVTKYIKEYNRCQKKKLPTPQVTEYIGECILAIAKKLANSPNFMNYPFKEEMISDGVINVLAYLTNFDYKKYKNPFAYYTQMIWYAFIRKIKDEKKHLYVKMKCIQTTLIDYDSEVIQASKYGSDYSDLNMNEFIDTFEKSNNLTSKKKKKALSAKKKMTKKMKANESITSLIISDN